MPHMTIGELGDDGKLKEALTIEVSESEVKEFRVGQVITVTIKGSVGMLQVPPDGTTDADPPLLGIRVDSKSIKGSNVFAELSADDDEDD